MTTVLKLGGSLITDKGNVEAVDRERLSDVCELLGRTRPDDIILIHGGGSFGHRAAEHHGVTTDNGTTNPQAIFDVTQAMDRLNDAVVSALHAQNIPAVGLPPRALVKKDSNGGLELAPLAISTLLAEAFVPVLHGDLVPSVDRGMTVMSGDRLAVAVAKAMNGSRIGLCANVPGVLDGDGAVIPEIDSYEQVADVLSGADNVDVSGGMAAKVKALLDSDHPGAIFGIEQLPAFLTGELPGTVIAGD